LEDMYSSERQIIASLPKLINLAECKDLRESLNKHLRETEQQASRIENIFSLLSMRPQEKTCQAMQGLLREADDIVKNKSRSSLLDAAIISAAQKVEHYEIASYGTLRSFAKQLDLSSQIIDLLQKTLDEEAGADKKLTKIAEGSLFSSGVNKKAISETVANV